MKKLVLFVAVVAAMSLTSCCCKNKEKNKSCTKTECCKQECDKKCKKECCKKDSCQKTCKVAADTLAVEQVAE